MGDDNVKQLLHELEVTQPERYELVQAARQAVCNVVPQVSEKVMYGGFMFSAPEPFCGVFAYKGHVSVEFSRGCDLDDPHGVLEGSGKLRRHIKLVSLHDISAKYLELFIHTAWLKASGR